MKKVFVLLIIFLSIFICGKVCAYKSYKVGDEVTYNDIKFYVIKDSGSDIDNITLLKAEPLSVEEVNLYGGVGTDNNQVNTYIDFYRQEEFYKAAFNSNGYGGMMYYSKELECGYGHNYPITDKCTNDYEVSNIKYVVDAWAKSVVKENYKNARLATLDEISNLGYECFDDGSLIEWRATENTPDWVYSNKYNYWLQTSFTDSNKSLYYVNNGILSETAVIDFTIVVRPVVELYKCAIDNSCDNNDGDIINDTVDNKNSDKKESITKVNTSNTLKKVSGLIILIGIVLVCAGLNIFVIIKNKDRKKD